MSLSDESSHTCCCASSGGEGGQKKCKLSGLFVPETLGKQTHFILFLCLFYFPPSQTQTDKFARGASKTSRGSDK